MDQRTFNVCRVCMIQEKSIPFKTFFIGNQNYSKYSTYLEWIANLKIIPIEGIPTLICSRCIENLENFGKFRNNILKANEKYQALLESLLNGPDDFEHVTCDKEKSPVQIKQEPNDDLEGFGDLEMPSRVKNEPLDEFREVDIQNFLEPSLICPKVEISIASTSKNSQNDLKCLYCTKIFENVFDLEDHMMSQHPGQLYESLEGENVKINCHQCDATFDNKKEKLEHMQSVHRNQRKQPHKNIGCTQCDEKFLNEFERQNHISKVHSKKSRKETHKNFYCIHCDEKFCNDFDRKEHIDKTHGKKKRFNRKPTPQGFTSPITEWSCAYCGLYFINKYDCYVHRRRLHEAEESTLKCPHCGKDYATLTLLRSHIKSAHSERKFMCPTCGKTFSNRSDYELHLKKEADQKDFVCEICSSRFLTNSILTKHMNVHTNEKPWSCDICGLGFKCKSSVGKHMQVVHLKLKPHVCEFCGRCFSIRHHLKGHLSRVHLIAEKTKI